jgi:hypothetical protein
MDDSLLFPGLRFAEWVDLWKLGYSDKFGPDDGSRYTNLLADVQRAQDDLSLRRALTVAFKWKDPLEVRWQAEIETLLCGFAES